MMFIRTSVLGRGCWGHNYVKEEKTVPKLMDSKFINDCDFISNLILYFE